MSDEHLEGACAHGGSAEAEFRTNSSFYLNHGTVLGYVTRHSQVSKVRPYTSEISRWTKDTDISTL